MTLKRRGKFFESRCSRRSPRGVASCFKNGGVIVLLSVWSLAACQGVVPNTSYVCEKQRDAELLYAPRRWSLSRVLSRECVGLELRDLTSERLQDIKKRRQWLVYNDGESAIELYCCEMFGEEGRLSPVRGARVTVECEGCEKGWWVGINSGGVYLWCEWENGACLFDRVFPGVSSVVVESEPRAVEDVRECNVVPGEENRCVVLPVGRRGSE